MAVAAPIPLLKSIPDMSRLNTFTGYMVTVTKHTGPKGTPGTSVVPTQKMTKDNLLALQATLPIQHGAGYYQFDVTDEGGTGTDAWMVKLGSDVMPTQEGFPMAGSTPFAPAAPAVPGAPLDPSVQQIMPGWFFNEQLGLLTTPWRETVQWRQGDPLPKPPVSGAAASHLQVVPPNAAPWNWPPQQQGWGGWGGYPANTGESDKIAQLEARLAEERRQREMDELRAESRRRDEENTRRMEEQARRFEALIEKVTSKPSGPTEAELRAQREVEETRRRLEETERRREESERETRRREEERAREERIQKQIEDQRRDTERMLRELSSNKSDPMLTLLGSIIQTQSASSAETIRTIRDASAAATAAAERGTAQVLELARTSREGAVESSKTVMESMKGVMDMQAQVYSQLLDVAGQGNQPWWANVVQEGVGKIGLIGQALMEQRQQQAQQPQVMMPAPQARRIAPAQPMRPTGAPIPQPAAPVGMAPVSAAPQLAGRPADAAYDQEKDEFVFPDGWRVPAAQVQRDGWPATIKRRHLPAPAPMPIDAAAVNGATSGAPVSVVPPAAAPAPKKRSRKKNGPDKDAATQASTFEGLRGMDPEACYDTLKPLDDQMLFGALLPYVQDLRDKVAAGKLPEEKAAEFILGTRAYATSFGGAPPPAFELLAAEQLDVLVERLLPDAEEDYKEGVVEIMETTLEAENNGTVAQQQ